MPDDPLPRKRSPRGSGDRLAEEILDAATDLLIEHGSEEAVSIRAVAGRVGVTPPSIYLHFADKNELIEAVCARFFEQFDAEMMAEAEQIDDLTERAMAQGLAYVRFALENPVIYRITFSRVSDADDPSLTDQILMSSALLRFGDTVRRFIDAGLIPEQDMVPLLLRLWSTGHGLASLMISKPGLPWGDRMALAETQLRVVLDGMLVDP